MIWPVPVLVRGKNQFGRWENCFGRWENYFGRGENYSYDKRLKEIHGESYLIAHIVSVSLFLLVFVYWRPIELMPIDCTNPPGTKGASIQPPLPHCGVGLCGGHVMDFVFSSVYSV